jgi:hypothetical protein
MERAIELVHGRGAQRPRTFAGGMDAFGLGDPIVAALLQDLPDAGRCRGYDPELTAAPPSLTIRQVAARWGRAGGGGVPAVARRWCACC